MNEWDMLAPNYLSDFFAVWFAGGRWLLAIFLLGPPAALVLAYHGSARALGARSGLWQYVQPFFALVRPSPQRSRTLRVALGLTMLASLIYLFCHFLISADPGRLTTTGLSLQSLGRADVLAAVQFLQRWTTVGWVLMFITLVLVLSFLNEGWELLPDRTLPRLKLTARRGPTVTHDGYRTGGRLNETRFGLTTDARIIKLGDEQDADILIVFEHEENGWSMKNVYDPKQPITVELVQIDVESHSSSCELYPNRDKRLISISGIDELTWWRVDGHERKQHTCTVEWLSGGNA